MLRVLDIIDKHRLLLVVTATFDYKNAYWAWEEGRPPVKHVTFSRAPLHDGDPVAWFTFYGDKPPDDFDPHPSLKVSIREEETPRLATMPAWNALEVIRYTVEDDIIERRFRRLFA